MQGLFNTAASILAVGLAFGRIGAVLSFAGRVIAGSFIAMSGAAKLLISPISTLKVIFGPTIATMAGAVGMAVGPFLLLVAAVTAVIAILVTAYNKSEIFRNAISDLVSVVGGTLKQAFDQINSAIQNVAPSIGGISGVFKTLGDFLGRVIVPIFSFVLVNAIKGVATVISGVITVVGRLITAFSGVAGAVQKAFSIVIGVVRGAINSLINVWNSTLGRLKITLPKIGPFGGGTIGFPTIPNFAEGGVVYPSSQGTLARVAEAGRPERIEPLDPDGLSKRDKAMIKLLSGEKGAGMTVNVYPSPGMDETELASLVSRQIAFSLRRGGA
jgi:hypothetical protein